METFVSKELLAYFLYACITWQNLVKILALGIS